VIFVSASPERCWIRMPMWGGEGGWDIGGIGVLEGFVESC